MGKARFKLSSYALERIFCLPYGARLLNIENTQNYRNLEFVFTVEHSDLPDGEEVYPNWEEVKGARFLDWGI